METENTHPMFSLIVTVGDDASCLEGALRSCIDQDFSNFEVLVVDFSGRTVADRLVPSLEDERLSVIAEPGVGLCAARNRGLAQARGDYVLFLDSTDELQLMWLSKAANRIALSQADAVQCATVYEKDGLTGGVHLPNDALFGFHQRLLFNHTVPLASMIVRRKVCKQFPEERNLVGEWEFWIETLRGRSVDVLPEYYGHIAQLASEETKKLLPEYQREKLQIMNRYYPELRFSLRKVRQWLRIRSMKNSLR